MHIPGIGNITEQRLWESGIQHWDQFTENHSIRLSPAKMDTITNCLKQSYQQLKTGNLHYFSEHLPANLHWRFFPEFRHSMVYLDIETTGLHRYHDPITTISLYDGKSINYYINGHNLNDFREDIEKYNAIVSYNGKTFDVPFIENYFGIRLSHAHIDLRYILGSLGYRGGLKSCETQLGIDRGDLKDIDGFFAVQLWYDYQKTGNQKALETLLAYNIQDVLSLEHLMVISYNLKIKHTPFYKNRLPEPVLPEIPFQVDMETVEKIKSENIYAFQNTDRYLRGRGVF
jgi:uncharacterized protein YprB with RNaseH-like and TPR domain